MRSDSAHPRIHKGTPPNITALKIKHKNRLFESFRFTETF
jgi:hypothetical protein